MACESRFLVSYNDKLICAHFLNRLKQFDYGTFLHSCRVAELSINIGELLKLNKPDLKQIYYTALLHDIGKLKIPHSILHKTVQLDADEWIIVRKHSQYGADILSGYNSKILTADLIQSIYHHHEHYSGKGYPDGLSGESIPVYARIIAIADALDAMINPRPYRPMTLAYDEAISELQIHAGTQFDPYIVKRIICSQQNLKGRNENYV